MFSEFTQTSLDLEVVLGDDTIVEAVGRGIVTFQRESMEPMTLMDVLYALGLKKNSISVSSKG